MWIQQTSLGAEDPGAGIGAIAGDYDNDGDLDLYVVNFNEPNVLLRNNRNPNDPNGPFPLSFFDVTADTVDTTASSGQLQLGVGLASHNGVLLNRTFTAVWLDYDRDGDLDLYVSSFDPDNGSRAESYLKPPGPGERSTLYQNMLKEDGLLPGQTPRFRDVTMVSGGDLFDSSGNSLPLGSRIASLGVTAGSDEFGRHNTPTDYFFGHMASVVADFNNDAWPDIAVVSSVVSGGARVLLYRNRGKIDSTSPWLGFELDTYDGGGGDSGIVAPMGITAGDYDNDGDLDLFITSTSCSTCMNDVLTNMLGSNGSSLAFSQQDALTSENTSWGAHWLDANNDGMLDLIVATQPNGNTSPTESYHDFLFVNNGINALNEREFIEDGFFSCLTQACPPTTVVQKSLSLMIADFDHDGFVDVFARHFGSGTDQLWRNVSATEENNTNNWLLIKLTGDPGVAGPNGFSSTKDAVGARVTAWAILDGTTTSPVTKQIREVRSGDSNSASSSSLELSFGFGQATNVALQVEFSSGQTFNYWLQFTAQGGGGIVGGKHLNIDEATATPLDINCNGVVNNIDLNIILNNLGCTSNGRPFCAGDLNFDSVVDDLDVQLWLAGQP